MHILHCLLPELSPKSIHYPQKAYISIVFDEKYPIIAYIILGLKKVYNIFKPRLHVYEPEKSSGNKVWQSERKIRDLEIENR